VNARRIGVVIAVATALVVSILFPLPMPAALAVGAEPTAAQTVGWGAPSRSEDFTGDLAQWSLYNGPGHDGNGRRTPSALGVANGILTISGNAAGDSEGMAWGAGATYGRWEARMRASAGDPDYHAVLLLWPDNEDEGGYGGEIDFMENSDPTRQNTEMFVHYGDEDTQLHGAVDVDATQWHNWAVEWAPDHITAFLDGKQWWSTSLPAAQPPGPMHMTVQLDQFRSGGGLIPSNLQVDWVRYYPITGTGPSPSPVNADGTCPAAPRPVRTGPAPPVSGAPGAGVAEAAAAAAAAGCAPSPILLPG
jgi:Glycosyl hydrolases family 16